MYFNFNQSNLNYYIFFFWHKYVTFYEPEGVYIEVTSMQPSPQDAEQLH
jgi:hypothetical protein